MTNLGDRFLQHVLRRSLQERGVSLLNQSDGTGAAGEGRAGRCKGNVHAHLALLRLALRGRLSGDACATVLLPPGHIFTKTMNELPRVTAQLVYMWLLSVMGVRIVALGRGISARSPVSRFQETWTSRLANYYTLRDGAALDRAREMGVRNAVWFPDLSWLEPLPRTDSYLPFQERTSVVLCFRDPAAISRTEQCGATSLLETIGRLVDQASALGLGDVEYVCHDEMDRPIMETIRDRSLRSPRPPREPVILSRDDIPSMYGKAALVLTNRLHALLFGLQWGAVGFALLHASGQHKIRDQLLDIGLEDHVIDADSEPPAGIVRSALERRDLVSQSVGVYREKAVTAASLTLAALFL